MKRKNLTEAQKAKAAERRERFGALCKKIESMSDGERAELVARVGAVLSCEGVPLSPRNTMLLLLQREGVSVVGGFRQWRKLNRYVMKGQKGLSIWIPRGGGESAAVDENKQPGEISSRELEAASRPKFLVGTVFDISQTSEAGADDEGEESEGGPDVSDGVGTSYTSVSRCSCGCVISDGERRCAACASAAPVVDNCGPCSAAVFAGVVPIMHAPHLALPAPPNVIEVEFTLEGGRAL